MDEQPEVKLIMGNAVYGYSLDKDGNGQTRQLSTFPTTLELQREITRLTTENAALAEQLAAVTRERDAAVAKLDGESGRSKFWKSSAWKWFKKFQTASSERDDYKERLGLQEEVSDAHLATSKGFVKLLRTIHGMAIKDDKALDIAVLIMDNGITPF